jgi:phage-related protein
VGVVRADDAGGIYRTVYVVRLRGAFYVLHAFTIKAECRLQAELDRLSSGFRLLAGLPQEKDTNQYPFENR